MKRMFLPQRRNGATKALRKRGSALRRCAVAGGILSLSLVVLLGFVLVIGNAHADDASSLIEAALYTRHEFFGAQAIVPFPTAEARNRLAEVSAKYPDNAQIYLKLSQLDEKLGNEELALQEMQSFVKHASDELKALQTMAEFLQRRAQFAGELGRLAREIHDPRTSVRTSIVGKRQCAARSVREQVRLQMFGVAEVPEHRHAIG